jgi:hypothetical protein
MTNLLLDGLPDTEPRGERVLRGAHSPCARGRSKKRRWRPDLT